MQNREPDRGPQSAGKPLGVVDATAMLASTMKKRHSTACNIEIAKHPSLNRLLVPAMIAFRSISPLLFAVYCLIYE